MRIRTSRPRALSLEEKVAKLRTAVYDLVDIYADEGMLLDSQDQPLVIIQAIDALKATGGFYE